MFRNLFVAAVLAAICAGLCFTVIQQTRLAPLIFAAEAFEGAADEPAAEAHTRAPGEAVEPHSHGEDEWMPQDGFERTAYSALANVLAAAGYALILGAVALFVGLPLTASNGLLWGIGGYVAFMLAPSFGLPPGLPTMPIAETAARQVWWWGTAIATGAGLIAAAKFRAPWAVALAAVLIVVPHLVGAPQPADEPTAVTASLAASFTASALAANAVMWAVLGLVMGYVASRLSARAPQAAATGVPA